MKWQKPDARVETLRNVVTRLTGVKGTLLEQAQACRDQAAKLRELATQAREREQEAARGRVDPA